jgi:hypothetical protein
VRAALLVLLLGQQVVGVGLDEQRHEHGVHDDPPAVRVSRRGGRPDAGGAVRGDHLAAGKDLAGVVEHDHAVAQQAPSLPGVAGDGAGGVAVAAVGRGARGAVGTHGAPLVWGC